MTARNQVRCNIPLLSREQIARIGRIPLAEMINRPSREAGMSEAFSD